MCSGYSRCLDSSGGRLSPRSWSKVDIQEEFKTLPELTM